MEWQQICEAIKDFFSQPVPIIGCTIGALVVSVIVILSKTNIGKKALHKMQETNNELKSQIVAFSTEITNIKQNLDKTLVEQNKDLQNALIEKDQEIARLRELVETIALNTHNVRTLDALKNYKKERENNENGRKEE